MPNTFTLDEYQEKASKTAIYKDKLTYPALGLSGEAGEVANKVKKYMRDGHLDTVDLAKELGDVLWYVAMVANDIDFDLSQIAELNIQKLNSRMERGTIQGSGDNR